MYASWEPEGAEMSVDLRVAEVFKHPASHCVLTGGEPMVAKGIRELAAALRSAGKHITIETAATVPPDGIACDLASLSPKLSNSAPDQRLPEAWRQKHEKLRWQPAVVREWIAHYPFQLKFVVTSASDLEEIQLLLREVGQRIPPGKILLMPEGISSAAIRGRDQTLVEICKQHGYRYCNRLHVEMFGHTRGT
jgi:7-carboxy-7-deazaguanine synthase